MENRKMENPFRAHLLISGRVQGVSFRWWARGKARDFVLTGWVRNLDDGRVEIAVEGEKDKLTQLIKLIEESGPLFSKVEKVEVEWLRYTGEFKSFEIVA